MRPRAAPTSDPALGPLSSRLPALHPLANAACAAAATAEGVWFEGGRIDALVRCGGALLRTSGGASTRVGIAQVRRHAADERLSLTHVLFAPFEPRPVLLSSVELESHSDVPLRVDYTEIWDVPGTRTRAEPGACVCETGEGQRALADASIAIRAEAPEPLPERGLALALSLGLAPRALRRLAFAYAAPPLNEEPSGLVQGWRGGVRSSLEGTVAHWLQLLGELGGADPIEAYRRSVRND